MLKIETAPRKTKDITSYVLGARAKANFGPAYINLGLTFLNQTALITMRGRYPQKKHRVLQGNDVKDATAWGVVAALGWKINDMWTLEASHGTLNSKQDTSRYNEDDAMVWGLQAKITMAPNVYIFPELIYQDNEDVSNNGVVTDQRDATIFGVYWRIDFSYFCPK